MLPVVRGERETVRQIVLYSFVLVGVTVVPFAWGTLGLAYLVAALVARRRLHRAGARPRARGRTPRRAALLFHYSLLYLALLFVAAAARRGGLMLDPETERKNMLWGWALFALFVLIAAGTVAVAFIYLAVD